jgi:hypothetical protein
MNTDRGITMPRPDASGICGVEPPTVLDMQKLEDPDHRLYVKMYGNPITNYLLDSEDQTHYDLMLNLDQASLNRRGEPSVCEALPELFAMEDEGALLSYAELAFARRALQEGELRLKEKIARAAELARRLAIWQERINRLKDSD